MSWCLSWWTPAGAGEVAVVSSFWAGVVALGVAVVRRLRAAGAARLTDHSDGGRDRTRQPMDEAPDAGARIGSTR